MTTRALTQKTTIIILSLILINSFSCQQPVNSYSPESKIPQSQRSKNYESASYKRFRQSKIRYEKFNEFNTGFKYVKLEGFQFEEGVERYYPSSIIKEDNKYYMWHSKPKAGTAVVGPKEATDETRAFHWDKYEVWYATSTDGYKWEEQGITIQRGPEGRYDHRSVFNPEILVADGKAKTRDHLGSWTSITSSLPLRKI